ncbi:MAG: hypothetical protein CML66_03355 [Rhodobacteraceae bacterium]|nr:hypothetical protein [Paracoccaceae bacterium]MAY46632.1 hypothetical protein [Paracoccaceae bacterium]
MPRRDAHAAILNADCCARSVRTGLSTITPSSSVDAEILQEKGDELAMILDAAGFFLTGGSGHGRIVEWLALQLHQFRADCPDAVWQNVMPLARAHRVQGIVMQDPIIARLRDKPRGYGPDGVTLDLFLGQSGARALLDRANRSGREICGYTRGCAFGRGLRDRGARLAGMVDATAARRPGAKVLTVGCAHLREAGLSEAFRAGRLTRWTALDGDEANLAEVARWTAGSVVEPKFASTGSLPTHGRDLGAYDLVCAAGALDDLPAKQAADLARRLFDLVRPGGDLVLSAFGTGGVPAAFMPAAFMEVFAAWTPILHDADALAGLARAATEGTQARIQLVQGNTGDVTYAIIRRPG